MEFTHEFHVPSDIDTTFATLTDLERVAPCLPGATLEEVDGDTYTGRVKVKVGPVQVTYRGQARLAEVDPESRTGRIEASGRETRGAGTASADVVATLTDDEAGTRVEVLTDLNITGKPAQFGRGAMADVGERIIQQFADRLRDLLETGEATTEISGVGTSPQDVGTPPRGPGTSPQLPGTSLQGVGTSPQDAGPRRIVQDPDREEEALDLLDVAGSATLKRLVPVVAGLAALVAAIWWWRSR